MAELDRYTQKAVDDPQFRAKLLKDANKAIKEEFDYEPPYKLTYHITDKNHIVFTLPPEDGALDENSLSNVAGGSLLNNEDLFKQTKNTDKYNLLTAYACYPDPTKTLKTLADYMRRE